MTTTLSLHPGTSTSEPFLKFSPLRSDGKVADQVILNDGFVLLPKPSESLPIGVWDYYPHSGVFCPGHVDWRGQELHPAKMRSFLARKDQMVGIGFWGIRHITTSPADHRHLGVIVESVLGGVDRPEVERELQKLGESIFGAASPGPASPTLSFVYPPLIHAIHSLMMNVNLERTGSGLSGIVGTGFDAEVPQDVDSFVSIMVDFLMSPTSPLYHGFPSEITFDGGVRIVDHPGSFDIFTDGPTTDSLNYSMTFLTGPTSTWERRMLKAGGPDPTDPFSPSVFTALTLTNSVRDLSPDSAKRLNLVEVLSRSPNTTYFDPHQEFPFDLKNEKGSVVRAAVESLLNPNTPDELAGPIGRTLASKVGPKTVRSREFSSAMEVATAPDWTPPKIASVVRSMKKLIAIIGDLDV